MLGKIWNAYEYTSTAIAILLTDNSDFKMFSEGFWPQYVTLTVSITGFLNINHRLVFRTEYSVPGTEYTDGD
jgi:hypothetical protein